MSIGSSVTSIEEYAFSGCSNLTTVISLNTTPPEIYYNTFDKFTYNKATLQVPIGCKTIYWLHPYWENFMKMEEIDVSSINPTSIDYGNDGHTYNLNGTRVGGSALGKGIYIKNGKKVVIK